VKNLREFFFDVLDFEPNQTPSHKSELPMKKNQSLSYMIDFDLHTNLYVDLTRYSLIYNFIQFDRVNPELKKMHEIFPGYGSKPIPFKLVIDKDFQDLYYDYSDDKLYTFMNFKFGGREFNLPIEKIAEV